MLYCSNIYYKTNLTPPEQQAGVITIPGISHQIGLDASLCLRYPDVVIDQEKPIQTRWRWFARGCNLKHNVPCALFIEADTGYLCLVPHLTETVYELSLNFYNELLMSLETHPEVHEPIHNGMFSIDPNPESIQWHKSNPSDMALQRRLKEAIDQMSNMSPAQANLFLKQLNQQAITLANAQVIPLHIMQERLNHYAQKWLEYSKKTNFFVSLWNMWRNKRCWVDNPPN